MKKLTSILLALVLLCSCIPAFAVSNCSASYKDGVLYYSCQGDKFIEVWLDGSPLASKTGNSIDGRKTINLSNGTHNVTFSDYLSQKTIQIVVGGNTGEGPAVCKHSYPKNPDKISTSTTYPFDASKPDVHTISTTRYGEYSCKLCGNIKKVLMGTSSAVESHKLSSATDTTCDRCNASINYDITTKVTKVELSESGTVKLAIGDTLVLGTTLTPSNGAIALKWSTSKSSVASVDKNGLVTAKKAGSATITVKTANGKKDTVKISVYDPKKVSSVTLYEGSTKLDSTLIVGKGSTVTLTGVIAPTTAEGTFSWKTSSSKYATVSANNESAVITAKGIGTATITVTVGGKKDTVKIKVVDPNKVAAIKLDKTGTQTLKVGSTLQLTPTYGPSTAAAPEYVWKSSNTKYATVDENGVVTAVKSGKTVTITCAVKGNTKIKTTVKVKTAK